MLFRSRLRSLSLNRCAGLDEKCLRSLAGWPGLSRLVELRLAAGQLYGGTKVTDAGVRALAASPHLTGLQVLRLESHGIQGTGALALAESPYLTNLRVLDLTGNPVPAKAEKAIRQRLGPGVLR